MPLTSSLNISPYYDNYDETKRFYRILFKPATAVQARELTQIQSIIQNQIERFGDSIYQAGTVIKGCPVGYLPALDFVRIQDQNLDSDIVEIRDYVNTILVSNTTGLKAAVVQVAAGSEATYPSTNRLYISYMNSGSGGEKTFSNNEVLKVYTKPVSANAWANSTVSISGGLRIRTLANTGSNTYTVSKAYGISVGDGIVYQKGFFVLVQPSVCVVNDDPTAVGNTLVGFHTTESIVTADQDSSLNDNALGYENESAPGADRLVLTANLVAVDPTTLTDSTNFTPIVQFNFGVPVIKDTDPQYSRLGDEFSRRQNETNGNYVVKPFTLTTRAHPNTSITNYFRARVSPGSGYVLGHRVELINSAEIDVRKGTDTQTASAQLATMNYGNFVYINELAGPIMFTSLQDIDLYDTAQLALTNRRFSTTGVLGSKIGTATARVITLFSGTPGLPDAKYKLHLFNIRMNSGSAFSQVRSVRYNGTYPGYADIVLESSIAVLHESETRAMLWSFGKAGVKLLSNGSAPSDAQYTFRQQQEITLSTDGTATLTLPATHSGGSNKLNYGLGIVGDGNEDDFMVTLVANAYVNASASYSVNVSSSNTTVIANNAGAAFSTTWNVGDYIQANTEIRRVTAITNSTYLSVDANFNNTASGKTYAKYYPAGHVFSLYAPTNGVRTVNVTSTTTAVVNVGSAVFGTLNSSANVIVTYNVLRYNTTSPATKTINKGSYVKIDCSTHTNSVTGPWCLGLADVHKLKSVYVGASFSNTNPDLLSYFYFDHGMTDTHYDLAKLYLKPGKSLPSGSKLFVKLDHFTPSYSSGIGFFSIQSYPVDDANTANTSAITTADIPVYLSETGDIFPLRDSIDFRPYLNNTANTIANGNPSNTQISSNPANATVNSFNVHADGTYVPTPDLNFQTTLTYYLPRIDIIYFTTNGALRVREGVATEIPSSPDFPPNGMSVAKVIIPPYPSLTTTEQLSILTANKQAKNVNRSLGYQVQTEIITNKRYTMRDIGIIDTRVSSLEYYMALSLLEKAATDMQIPDTNGLNRFKNGIFVDPFTSHQLGDVSNPEYKIAIDQRISVARPYFTSEGIEMSVANTSNTTQTGSFMTLPFNAINYIDQSKASKTRSVSPVSYRWAGTLYLYPSYDQTFDKTIDPTVNVTVDAGSALRDFANSPFGTNWGEWEVVSSDRGASSVSSSTQFKRKEGVDFPWQFDMGYETATTTSTMLTTSQTRVGQKLNIDVSSTSYNLGSVIDDIAMQPYMRSREVAFYAANLRPSTRVYAFFDDVAVSDHCAPGTINGAVTDPSDSNKVTRTGNWGDALTTDSTGKIAGMFLIETGKFHAGEKTFKLVDVTDVENQASSITTTASAKFTASTWAVKTHALTMTTLTPQASVSSLTDSRVVTTADTSTAVSWQSTIPQSRGGIDYGSGDNSLGDH